MAYIYVYDIPNVYWLAFSFVIATFATSLLIRFVYFVHGRFPRDYGSLEANLSIYGFTLVKLCGVLVFGIMSGLAYRLDAETPEGKMFTVDGLTYRFWAYTRILFAFLVFFSAYLFDSHPFFRNFCCILTPALGCLDLISNIAYANQIYCRDRGICETEQALYDTYVDMWWRDIISFGATIIGTIVFWWLGAIMGLLHNYIYFPRREHRALTLKLDSNNNLVNKTTARKKI